MTYIIVDFEATCCNKGTVPRNEMEIIEIGAVALDGNGPQILGEFQSFIKPIRHSILTQFCMELTTINQDQVDNARLMKEVMIDFSQWINSFEMPVFCSWGNYDRNHLLQDCAFNSVDYPFSDSHINIKQRFAKNLGLKKSLGLGNALKQVNFQFKGTPHRAIDDVRNMACISKYIFGTQHE